MRTARYIDEEGLDMAAAEWLEQIRRSVAPRPGLKLQPERAALLVIDMLRYFADPAGRCYLPAARAIVPRLEALLSAWRTAQRPVVFTRHGHHGEHDLGMLGRFFSDYIRAGEPESEIIDRLCPGPGERIIEKTTYDAFLGTGLQSLLEELQVEQVVITGVLTHMCCETTARAAFCRGFEVYVPVDGVASSTEALHVGSLLSMADAAIVAMSTSEVIERCATTR